MDHNAKLMAYIRGEPAGVNLYYRMAAKIIYGDRFVWTHGLAIIAKSALVNKLSHLIKSEHAIKRATGIQTPKQLIHTTRAAPMTNKDIKQLTPDQEAMIDNLIQEWIGHGLRCEPADRDMAQHAMGRIYKQSKFKVPEIIIWAASPLDGCKAAATIAAGKLKQLGSYEPTPEEIRAQLNTCIYGQHEASWLAFYHAYQNLGITGLDEIIPFQDLGRSSGWVWPFDNAIVFCERPKSLHFDERHDLHNEKGPAIWYPGATDNSNTIGGGMKVYCINNAIVPEKLIMAPESITVSDIKEHTNTEVRRLLRQAYGNGRYLADIGARVIDVDTVSVDAQDRHAKTITRALMEDDEGHRWLIASDGSTDRVYSDLRAPDDCNSCAEAYQAITGAKDNQIIAQG